MSVICNKPNYLKSGSQLSSFAGQLLVANEIRKYFLIQVHCMPCMGTSVGYSPVF